MSVSVLQCCSTQDPQENIKFIRQQLTLLPRKVAEPELVVLPECALLFGGNEQVQLKFSGSIKANSEHQSELKTELSALAKEYQVWLVAGTIPALSPDGRVFSRSYLFDDLGITQGYYDKLHLFDVTVADSTGSYRESDTFCPGEGIEVFDTPFGRLGLAICYDLRFPELFRALRLAGAEIIALPSAFTAVTGQAHWQTLVQARALDSQCFILAADQWGKHQANSRETWGQSMIVDPWGKILAQLSTGTGWIQAKLDKQAQQQYRQAIPIMKHNRFVTPQLMKANTN